MTQKMDSATGTAQGQVTMGDRPWEAPEAHPFVRIENITKSFGDFTAVDDLSLDIYAGEFFTLLGGSGCGKSTLLRMLAGLETPTSGRIMIDGQDMTATPPYDRPVNMMFQSYALFPHMSVERNIAFGLKQDKIARAEIRDRVAEALELVQLQDFGKRKPDQLSGGQRQRVALARCLVKQPKLLLLDEPLAALDKNLRERTQFELARIQEQVGITFVLVTHDQQEAISLSSRIAVMDQGNIVQTSTPQEVYEYPANRFVANFVGSVNMFEGRMKQDGVDQVMVSSLEAGGDIVISHGPSAPTGTQCWIAVRPEKMVLSAERPETHNHNIVAGTIDEIAYQGSSSLYQIRLASGKLVRVSRPIRAREAKQSFIWGQKIWVSWHYDASVVLLD